MRTKSSKSSPVGISPLAAVGLAVGGFVAGLVAERKLRVTGKIEETADQSAKKIEAKVVGTTAAAKAMIEETKQKAITAIEGETDPEWGVEDDGNVLYRTIRGQDFIIFKESRRGKTGYFLDTPKYGSDETKELGRFESLSEAKEGAESAAKQSKGYTAVRRNSGLSDSMKKYRDDVVDTFHSNARVSPNAVKSGSVVLYGVVFTSKDAFEGQEEPVTDLISVDDPALWEATSPGCVVEIVAMDPEDESGPLSDSDIVPIEIVGIKSADRYFAEQGTKPALPAPSKPKANTKAPAKTNTKAPAKAPKSNKKKV